MVSMTPVEDNSAHDMISCTSLSQINSAKRGPLKAKNTPKMQTQKLLSVKVVHEWI